MIDKAENKEYLPMEGLASFRKATVDLLLGKDNPAIAEVRLSPSDVHCAVAVRVAAASPPARVSRCRPARTRRLSLRLTRLLRAGPCGLLPVAEWHGVAARGRRVHRGVAARQDGVPEQPDVGQPPQHLWRRRRQVGVLLVLRPR